MGIRETFDLSAYLVVGPENTLGRPVADIVRAALRGGFTCVQVRAKHSEAREILALCEGVADVIRSLGREDDVALLVDDRLDVVLAAREAGLKVDGVHVGQGDVPPAVCRKYLGEEAIVGLSARREALLDYIRTVDTSGIDYFGTGPFHASASKPDAGRSADGRVVTRSLSELAELCRISPLPVVVGGGVTAADLSAIRQTGAAGFFVIRAVAGAADPERAAEELVRGWA